MKKIAVLAGQVLLIVLYIAAYYSLRGEYHASVDRYIEDNKKHVDFCLEFASEQELILRMFDPNTRNYNEQPSNRDTAEWVTSTIETMDTTFQVRIKRHDGKAHIKIRQFIFKGFMPVNLHQLDSIFLNCIRSNGTKAISCYTEYIDLKKNKVIAHSEQPKPTECIETNIFKMDIINTIGMKSYVVLKIPTFWEYQSGYNIFIYGLVAAFLFVILFISGRYFFKLCKKK